MFSQLCTTFIDLIQAPFREPWMIWGIVPLYFALLLNELTSSKANFRTALQTGFSFVWAAAQWLYPYFTASRSMVVPAGWQVLLKINIFVSLVVMVLGVVALISGLRRHYPKYCSFLGHTRFSNYFMITIYPIQAHYLAWSWERLAAIALFAVPIWLVLHLGLMPLRR